MTILSLSSLPSRQNSPLDLFIHPLHNAAKMAPSVVSIDNASDFNVTPAPPKPADTGKRTLLLAPPSIATQEDKLRAIFTTYDRSTTDLQMLDRVSAGFVSLPQNKYDLVLVLTDTDGTKRTEALQLLKREVYAAVIPAMKGGAKVQTQDNFFGEAEEREAVLAGLVKTEGGFEKMDTGNSAAVPLKLGRKKKASAPAPAPAPAPVVQPPPVISSEDNDLGEEELIDEDTLLSADDLKRPIVPRKLPRVYCHLAHKIQPRSASRNPERDAVLVRTAPAV